MQVKTKHEAQYSMTNIKLNSSELLSDNIRILAIPKTGYPSFTNKSSDGQH